MSVAEQLGLTGHDSEMLVLAEDRWPRWTEVEPALAVTPGVPGLRDWLRAAPPADADDVLLALVTVAAPDGGDDVAAAAVVAWALLPGACVLANRLRTLTPRIDEVVAAQLWVEIRTFAWRRLRKVAANILLDTRVGVLRECGVVSQVRRVDRTWSSATPLPPDADVWAAYVGRDEGPTTGAARELSELLEWACTRRVIDQQDRDLILSLVAESDAAETTRCGRGRGGLMANDVSAVVGQRWGLSAATVRRRARRSVQALTDACADLRLSA